MSKQDHPEYEEFDAFFHKHLMHNGTHLKGSCFERDTFRDSKDFMWMQWKKRSEEYGNTCEPLEEWMGEHIMSLALNITTHLSVYMKCSEDREGCLRMICTSIREWTRKNFMED